MSDVNGFRISFVTGVYRGKDSNGTPEPLPDTARLLSALVAAAGRAGRDGDTDAALTWMENNPPTVMLVPSVIVQMCEKVTHIFNNPTQTQKDRTKAVAPVEGAEPSPKKEKVVPRRYKTVDDYEYGYVIHGDLAWGWENVPENHAAVFSRLTRYVAYLGDPDSVVRVSWGPVEGHTHVLAPAGQLPVPNSVRGFSPVAGRVRELDERHAKILEGKRFKDAAADAAVRKVSDLSRDFRDRVRSVVYSPLVPVRSYSNEAPWNMGVWFPMSKDILVEDAVDEAGRVHRNLVRSFSNAYSARCEVLHGRLPLQERTAKKASNNVAIQFIPSGFEHAQGDGAGLLIMVPRDAPLGDRDALLETILGYRPHHTLSAGTGVEVDPSQWWAAVPVGHRRLWVTRPLAVSEHVGAALETLAATSLRYVLRDTMTLSKARGCVLQTDRVEPHVGIDRFIHRTSLGARSSLARNHVAFTSVYNLNGVTPESAVIAVGQSRHFSTGLLVPVNIPA